MSCIAQYGKVMSCDVSLLPLPTNYLLQPGCGELGVIPPEVGIWRENTWAKHDCFDAEADQQDIAKEPHRCCLVLLIANISNQGSLVDVAILEASQMLFLQGGFALYAGVFEEPDRSSLKVPSFHLAASK